MGRSLVDVRVLQREYLLAISRALTAELELHDLLRLILQAAVDLVAGDAGMVALAEPGRDSFRVAAVYGIPAEQVDHFAPLMQDMPYQEGTEGEALPELTRRLHQVAKKIDLALTRVFRLPMISGDEVIGLIYVFQAGTFHHLVQDAPTLLRSFAEQAAIAVKNARLYEQINKEKQRVDAILEQSADGVMILDSGLHITVFNQALSRMTGWSATEAIGRHHDDVIRWDALKTDTDLNQALANGWPLPGAAHLYVEGTLQRQESGIHRSERPSVNLGITYAPMLSDLGQMTDIIANVRDLTRYREEQALQKTFISVISHELKTPVSIIKGYAGTLLRQDANWSPEILIESLHVIEEEADNLTALIDNLLEVSRLQAGIFSLEISEEVRLPKLAASTARRFETQTDRHTFSLDFDPDFPIIYGDERRLTQVLNNLVSNAIKYSPEGGRIEIWGEVHSEHVTISVRDEGIGIPAHQQNRIFQKFSRLDNALSRKTEGTGLGLYLSKAIIEAHNGRIWFTANQDGPGTTFTFSLPKN
jgi:signal transduction histidine kinase